jgi:hypothetical protein
MTGPDGQPFTSGTLVIFGEIDRLTSGGHYGTSLSQKLSDLRTFIARAYRKFLDKGLIIELNGTSITLLDPPVPAGQPANHRPLQAGEPMRHGRR